MDVAHAAVAALIVELADRGVGSPYVKADYDHVYVGSWGYYVTLDDRLHFYTYEVPDKGTSSWPLNDPECFGRAADHAVGLLERSWSFRNRRKT